MSYVPRNLPTGANEIEAVLWFHDQLIDWASDAGIKGLEGSVVEQLSVIQGWVTEGLMGLVDPLDPEEAAA